MADSDILGAFLSETTCESLVHKLERKNPKMMKELLDITTSHAASEDVGWVSHPIYKRKPNA